MDELLKNVVVHCKTEDEANQVLDLADKLGYVWSSSHSFKNRNSYEIYKSETCYNIYEGCYGDLNDYKSTDIKIISAQEFINMVNEKIKIEIDINSLIPEGYEIDKENSTLECIKFKKKSPTYDDIAKELFLHKNTIFINERGNTELVYSCAAEAYSDTNNCTSRKQAEKLMAINKLMNVAKYLNKDWKPNWNDCKDPKWLISITKENIKYCITRTNQYQIVYFRTIKLAKQAVEILGEDTIKLALSTDY